jgi:dephospho-CoA kinase
MLHVALTGNIASGKSTVATLLAAHGATIIDADELARAAVAPGTAGLEGVVERFGPGVLAHDGSLDRAALRARVFRDAVARDALNAIVHPAVRRLREEAVAAAHARGDRIVVSDIPLLFEVGLEHAFDAVILVDAPEPVRLARLVRDRGLGAEEAQAMIDAQWPSARKGTGSTWVIDNSGDRDALAAGVQALWTQIEARAGDDGRPGAEEAFAQALAAADEAETVVWTVETAEAWGVAQKVLATGDEVGARMAFREVYTRLVAEARAARRPVQWLTALGHDRNRHADALRKAADLGRIPRAEADAAAAADDDDDDDAVPGRLAERLQWPWLLLCW